MPISMIASTKIAVLQRQDPYCEPVIADLKSG